MGTIYLIHLSRPYKHARHYLGYTNYLRERINHHKNGTGARLLQVVNAAGIGWRVVRTWKGSRDLERKLKKRKESPNLCPVCNPDGYAGLAPGNGSKIVEVNND